MIVLVPLTHIVLLPIMLLAWQAYRCVWFWRVSPHVLDFLLAQCCLEPQVLPEKPRYTLQSHSFTVCDVHIVHTKGTYWRALHGSSHLCCVEAEAICVARKVNIFTRLDSRPSRLCLDAMPVPLTSDNALPGWLLCAKPLRHTKYGNSSFPIRLSEKLQTRSLACRVSTTLGNAPEYHSGRLSSSTQESSH